MADGAGQADGSLVRRLADRDEGASDALASLFREHAPVAYALARRITRQDQLAEEVVQESFLGLWNAPDSYRPDRGGVRSYLLAAVHHRAVDAIRREQTQRKRQDEEAVASGTEAVEGDVAEEVADRAEQDEHRQQVSAALGGLPEDQRRVLTMMYFDGKSQRDIAEELGVPLGTIKSRTLLAMRKLRSSLDAPGRGEHP